MDSANARALSDLPVADATAGGAVSHIRPVEARPRNTKFAAVGEEISRILGPHRGAKLIYGYLASAWFEYADPKKIAERNGEYKRQITPGDWVSVDYKTFFAITGTKSKDSIARWIRILTEDVHECPWPERCTNEHPLVVFKRQGHGKPNRYRKWRCGEDERVVHEPIVSPKLKDAAQEREARKRAARAAEFGIPIETGPESQQELGLKSGEQTSALAPDLTLEARSADFKKSATDERTPAFLEVRSAGFITSGDRTSGSPPAVLHEARLPDDQKSDDRTSLRVNTPNTDSVENTSSQKTANPTGAAAIEEVDEIEAVACEVVERIVDLGRRVDPGYTDAQAWDLARILAASVLEHCQFSSAAARAALIRAIASPQLARAQKPLGLLRRGIVGDRYGNDRYLLVEALPVADRQNGSGRGSSPSTAPRAIPPGAADMLRQLLQDGKIPSAEWLRQRDLVRADVERIRAEMRSDGQTGDPESLVDVLAATDPSRYEAELATVFARIAETDLGQFFRGQSLTSPIVRGMCRAQLERDLRERVEAGTSQ
jgi:hypothetical protein